jgi:hypothetical protein
MIINRRYVDLFIVFILIVTTFRTIVFFNTYGSTDLRARIVGARLMNENKSPYFYQWKRGDNEKILDPNINTNREVNGNVVTPAYLILLQFVSQIPYYEIQVIWGILQCLFLCLAICMITRYLPLLDRQNVVLLILTVLLFSFSDIWVYNIERGQTYTLFAFLFCLVVIPAVTKSAKFSLISGFINGLIGFLRPSFFLLIIVFFVRRNYRFCIGQIVGAMAGLLLFVVPYYDVWKDFFNAMHLYSLEIINGIPSYQSIQNSPNVIEGLSTLRNVDKDIHLSAILSAQNYLKNIGIVLNSTTSSLICIAFISCYSYLFYKKQSFLDNTKTILFAFLIYMTAEYFFIGARGSYSIIQWLLPVYFFVYNAKWQRIILLLFAFSQIFVIPSLPFNNSQNFQGLIGEGILYVVCVYDVFVRKSNTVIKAS